MADSEERIKIQFDTNADDTKKSVDGLNASIDVSIDENEKLAKSNNSVSETQSKVTKGTKEQKAGFEDLGSGIGDTIAQVKGLGKQFLLLLANPIILFLTAVVGVLALVFKAFTSTNDGADKMERIMASVGATVDVLRDRLLQLFNALTSFDFKGIVDSFRGVGDEIEKEAKQAAKLAGALQEVEDATRSLGVSRSKLNRDLSDAKELITDETASYAEKKKAIDLVKKAEGEQTEQELANAKKKYNAIKEQNALSDSSDEALQKEADALSAVYALQQKSADDRRAIRKTELRADKEESARLKAISDERKARDKERNDREKALQKERNERRKAELKAIEDFNKMVADKEMALLKSIQDANAVSAQEKLDLQKQRDAEELRLLEQKGANVANLLAYNNEIYASKQLEIDEANRLAKEKAINDSFETDADAAIKRGEQEKAISDAMIAQKQSEQASLEALGSAGLNAAKDIFTKNKAIQKGVIVAEGGVALGKLAVNTVEAVGKDNAASPLTFGMPWSGIHIATGALGAASIIANTAKALKAVGGGGSAGSAPQLPSVRGAAATPQAGFQASSENQIATSIAGNAPDSPVVKAYVVAQDMTDQQAKDKKLVSDNSFGGIN